MKVDSITVSLEGEKINNEGQWAGYWVNIGSLRAAMANEAYNAPHSDATGLDVLEAKARQTLADEQSRQDRRGCHLVISLGTTHHPVEVDNLRSWLDAPVVVGPFVPAELEPAKTTVRLVFEVEVDAHTDDDEGAGWEHDVFAAARVLRGDLGDHLTLTEVEAGPGEVVEVPFDAELRDALDDDLRPGL